MTKQDIQKIAGLARLQIPESELGLYARELSSILEYIGQLNEVETDSVPITSQVTGLVNAISEDRVENCEIQDELLAMAPNSGNHGVKVKRVIA
jgi:aspartyl-tRNA(Asn)/glutamyl-tRNA(Gln) amidotransferase subunit C